MAASPDPSKGGGDGKRPRSGRHHRKISNYLLDKRLQLRYVLVVLFVSLAISGTLGYLIYQQEHRATEDLVAGLSELTKDDPSLAEYQKSTAADIAHRDRNLVLQMIGVGLGLAVIAGGYLVLMTHKVAGPLHKIGNYMHDMASGRMHTIMPLRKGDMLQDFYLQFRDMHHTVRERLKGDAASMSKFYEAATGGKAEPGPEAKDELEELRRHAEQRHAAFTDERA
ncbi:MAG TPA: hypothetical protein VHE35_01660 [Kofleriaceae bacterium]|nr:hypothetical protein [Kofleriaceae bacterium]